MSKVSIYKDYVIISTPHSDWILEYGEAEQLKNNLNVALKEMKENNNYTFDWKSFDHKDFEDIECILNDELQSNKKLRNELKEYYTKELKE